MDEERTMERSKNVLEISPLSKGKRALAFLADYFLVLILTLVFFHFAAYPIGKAIIKYDQKHEEYAQAVRNRDNVLYGNELLFYSDIAKKDPTYMDENIEYTSKIYIYEFLKGSIDVEAYNGHQGDIFHTYYVNILNDEATYLSLYQGWSETGFFDINGNAISLKQEYVEEFSHNYLPGDSMSNKGKEDYERMQTKVYLVGYRKMIASILEKDLTFAGKSYKLEQAAVDSFIDLQEKLTIFSVLSAYALSSLFQLLLFPLINKYGKTFAMLFMRNERLDSTRLYIWSKPRRALHFVYSIIMNFSPCFLVPIGVYSFAGVFSIPYLLPLSLVSLGYVLISTIFMLFEPYNRTLSDRLTGTVMVSQATLDDIIRAKGYDF